MTSDYFGLYLNKNTDEKPTILQLKLLYDTIKASMHVF